MKIADIIPFIKHNITLRDVDDQLFTGIITNFVDEFESSSGKLEIEMDLGDLLLGIPVDEIESIQLIK